MKKNLLAVLIVVTDPYSGLDYNKINVYEVNYCNYYCPEYQKEERYSSSFEDDLKEEYRDEEDRPLIFDLDFWTTKK